MKVLPTLGSAYSGSLAGITAAHNRGGAYFRARTIPVNPTSPAQSLLRGSVASVTQSWASVLTEAQRLAWDLYAQNVSWTDALGQTISLSGVNMFVRSAAYAAYVNNALTAGAVQPTDAPTTFALGVTPIVGSVTTANTVGPPAAVTATVTIANSGDYTAGDILVAHMGPPKGSGINFFAGPYIATVADDATTGSIVADLSAAPYSDRYPAPAEGNKVWGYLRVIHADGRLSSRSKFGPGVVPAPA